MYGSFFGLGMTWMTNLSVDTIGQASVSQGLGKGWKGEVKLALLTVYLPTSPGLLASTFVFDHVCQILRPPNSLPLELRLNPHGLHQVTLVAPPASGLDSFDSLAPPAVATV